MVGPAIILVMTRSSQSRKFMHNGGIAEFHLVKRRLQAELSDEIFNIVQGNTGKILSLGWEWEIRLLSECRFGVGIRIVFVQGGCFHSQS